MTGDPGRDSSCIFCAIAAGEAAASVVYDDEAVVAFMDLHPVTPGHLLVVPRVHSVGLEDLDEATAVHVWKTAHRLARALRHSDLTCEGINLFLADGEAAFQEVFHVHLHVIPRYTGDGFRIHADWKKRPRSLLDADAQAVRAAAAQSVTDPPSAVPTAAVDVDRLPRHPSRAQEPQRGVGDVV